nr:MAG TPA: hypothetical protein [Caudoviricetes sp.]
MFLHVWIILTHSFRRTAPCKRMLKHVLHVYV